MELTPDQERLMTFGRNPAKFAAALARNRKGFIGKNVVMARVSPGGASLEDDDEDETGLFEAIDDGASASEIATAAKKFIEAFLQGPDEKNSHENLARAGAMCSAALSRCARDNALKERMGSGRGLADRR